MSAKFDADLWLRVPRPDGRQREILAPGCTVVLASSPLQRGIVCGFDPDAVVENGYAEDVYVAWITVSSGRAQGPHVSSPLDANWLALDLAEVSGRNRAATWLAGGVWPAGQTSLVSGCTAPTWSMGEAAWRLAKGKDTCLFLAELSRGDEATLQWLGGAAKRVPAFALLNRADPRRLADGSRWVDARALVLACEAIP